MKVQNTYLIVLLFLFQVPVFAQREGAIEYEQEFLAGINFNTNAGLIGGVTLRYSKLLYESKKQFHNFGLDLGIVKHPKELRYANQSGSGSFIAYKSHHLVVLRPTYGREFVLFHKGNEDGVQLDLIINAGLSIGILTPYYIQYQEANSIVSETIPYKPDIANFSLTNIISSSGYLTGFGESKIVPGLHLKTGFSFEYGHYSNKVTGLEVGFLLEAFTQKMVMMESPSNVPGGFKNNQVFTSVYITIFYGGRK